MRHLSLVGERRRKISLKYDDAENDNNTRRVVAVCQTESDGLDLQGANNSTRFILTNDGMLAKVSLGTTPSNNGTNNEETVLWICNVKDVCEQQPPDNKKDEEWFSLDQVDTGDDIVLVCLSRNGAIVTVDPKSGQAELVGEFEHGLQAASFSPDGEVLCLLTYSEPEEEDEEVAQDISPSTTKNSALLLMNTQWEVLAENKLENHLAYEESDDTVVSMCWRPDGSLVAVSTVDVADQQRKIRIFKRDNLQWHAIARTEDGSGKLVPNIIAAANEGISWAGAGCSQLLAAAQRKSKKTLQIIFMEPNGNRHREFVLRENPVTTSVLGLTWNVESDLLAVSLRDTSLAEKGIGSFDKVQLWHRSNYHWYMKQEFRFEHRQVSRVVFDEENSNLMSVFFHDYLEWREYDVLWQPSNLQFLKQVCAAHIVDGSLLNITALNQAMVPPPMYANTIAMNSPICHFLLSNDDTKSVTAMVVLSDGSIVLLSNPMKKNGRTTRFTTPVVVAEGSFKDLEQALDYTALRSFMILDQSEAHIRLLAVSCAFNNSESSGGDTLVIITVNWNELDKTASVSYDSSNLIPLKVRVLCLAPWSDSLQGAIVEVEDGTVFEVKIEQDGTGSLHELEGQEFMEPCNWIAGLKDAAKLVSGEQSNEDSDQSENFQESSRLIVGLSSRSRLYCRDILLADAVSSFSVSVAHQYLCYVAAQGPNSQLRFLPLRDLHHFDALMGSDDNLLLEGYEPRNVERGSRLVAILPGSPTAVLQVPRGNLEGTYPRSLVLRFVMTKIGKGDYGEAFSMMRRQKVNLNLIVDLNPRMFLDSGIRSLLKQVTAIDHLNLFISCLQNWDSTQTQYRIPPWLNVLPEQDAAVKKVFDFTSKVNQVCRKLRMLMLEAEKDGQLEDGIKISEGYFLLPILTTFAKEDPPKLEEALTLIKENAIVKSNQINASTKKPPLFSDAAQSSIQYLAFLADHELIFNVGLGLYDFDVARACARNSQMDPKVYLPLLKRLRSLPKFYGRYEVDLRLKRHEKALRNLFESGQQKELLGGIESVQLDDSAESPSTVGNGFEHCLLLIEKYRLHNVGLDLFKHDNEAKRSIMLSLGEHLLKEGRAESALTVFLAAEPVEIGQAKAAARACRNWKCFFTLSFQSDQHDQHDQQTEEKIRQAAARELAEGFALTSENQYNLQNDFDDAARMLLDYCKDVDRSVDMLTNGWLFQEGCRVATLHSRPDLVQKCIDAALVFAEKLQSDLEDKKEGFITTNKRYEEVLEIRKDAIRNGEQEDNFLDEETGSLFSLASNASNMSLQSTASTDSLSSVISIKSVSSFSITGREEETRHKSRFNRGGGKQKKKKKKKQGKNRIRPGSVEELQSLVATLRASCGDKDFCRVLSDTIEFLSQTGRSLDVARGLFQSYLALDDCIQKCQSARVAAQKTANLTGGHDKIPITLPVEDEMNKLSCPKLSDSLYQVFSLL